MRHSLTREDVDPRAPDREMLMRGIHQAAVAALLSIIDCIIEEIDEFAAELNNPGADPEERVIALKSLLHFVGDLHQPLHAADGNGHGGNDQQASAPGMRPGNLDHYWDPEFVVALGREPRRVAADLIEGISEDQQKTWAKGTATAWAQEAFAIPRDHACGEASSAGWPGRISPHKRLPRHGGRDRTCPTKQSPCQIGLCPERCAGG
jgi:S1/P1 Nuclease